MNPLIQNIAGVVSAVSVTVLGMVGIETRYLDEGEATALYQSSVIAERRAAAQLAVNTSVAATLIDLRIRQYQYISATTDSEAERAMMAERLENAQHELVKLGKQFAAALEVSPFLLDQSSAITGSD